MKEAANVIRQGVVVCDTSGRLFFASEAGTDLLRKYFPVADSDVCYLPESLTIWIEGVCQLKLTDADHGSQKFFVHRAKNSFVSVRIVSIYNKQITLLIKENKAISPEHLRSLGLTERETVVLYWLTQGKNNPTIAILCDISPNTVRKHVENIHRKLGVENRTEAVLRAIEQ